MRLRECLVEYEQSSNTSSLVEYEQSSVRLDWLVHTAHPGLQDRFLLNYTTGLPTCLHQKNTDLVPKKPDSSFEAYTRKTCTTTHKIDIKTRRKHQYNTSPIFRSIFFPRNYTVTLSCICFLSTTSIIFRATVNFLQYFVHLHRNRPSSQEICNEYAAQTMFC